MADLVGGGLMLGVDWFVVGCNGVVGWLPFWLLLVFVLVTFDYWLICCL